MCDLVCFVCCGVVLLVLPVFAPLGGATTRTSVATTRPVLAPHRSTRTTRSRTPITRPPVPGRRNSLCQQKRARPLAHAKTGYRTLSFPAIYGIGYFFATSYFSFQPPFPFIYDHLSICVFLQLRIAYSCFSLTAPLPLQLTCRELFRNPEVHPKTPLDLL